MLNRKLLFSILGLCAAGLAALTHSVVPDTANAKRDRYSKNNKQHVAGKFDYFQLVMSWSPTHCASNSRGDGDTQCGRRRARPYGFVLHGLWPQYAKGYPSNCRTKDRPFVPNPVIDSMMDIMPSRGLIIHEYKKHGTCSGLSVSDYFRVSRAMYRRVKIPADFNAPSKPIFMTPDELVTKFVRANPALKPNMMRVICGRGNRNQLREIRLCLTRKGAYQTCLGRRDHQCRNKKMYIPPVR